MMPSQLLSVFLSFVIAAVIQISYVLTESTPNDTKADFSPNTTTSEAVTAHPAVVTSSMSTDLGSSPTSESSNNTEGKKDLGISQPDSTMLLRSFYVLLAVTAIIVVYFVVRTVRMRLRKNRKTRYGLLSTHDDSIEMRHLEEDEEDATVFDRSLSHSRR